MTRPSQNGIQVSLVTGKHAMAFAFQKIYVQGTKSTFAEGINDSGEIAGIETFQGPVVVFRTFGFLYSNGTFTQLNDPHVMTGGIGPAATRAYDINNADQIVGTYTLNDFTTHGFLYS